MRQVRIALGGIKAPRSHLNCHSFTRLNMHEMACVGERRIRWHDRAQQMR
jgi:hypothetical protein